ncbi:hypothetical protein B9Z19DRAFT_1109160 [Tuber borchii]|uniref:Uncharacterized protein n=1 Tax=Tuber borchii TaxID=42251 RepID=A0A2T6ZNA3_TUBBO|nr:hypothetical protein B9Z19DRAFT_1109160 [Tuber borchii]
MTKGNKELDDSFPGGLPGGIDSSDGTGACISSFLAQYQTSLFLGYRDQWRSALLAMRTRIMDRGNPSLKYGWEMVTLANQFLSQTEVGDFPGRFCENIYEILGAMGRAKGSLNFYSASVISFYEELTLSLIFLVRPYEFLIPDSWHCLYFKRWERKYRSPSALERFRYKQCLAKVCLSFCKMVINIEGSPTKEFALAWRSITLIVVCLINLGTFFPRPREYAELWRKSQEVFSCARLDARGIQGLRGDELIGRLTKVFQEYRGKDSIRLVWGRQGWVDSFAGIPLKGNRISVVPNRPTEERNRNLRKPSRDQRTRKLNAAHILTAFWKLNGPRVLKKMKEHRDATHTLAAFWKLGKMKERRNAACILTNFWKLNGPRFLEKMKERRNTAHILNAFWKLEKMKERRNAAHILTTFWKLNGPRFLEKMKEHRRYFAPRYKYPKNCCLLVDMRGDRNWMY